MAAAKPRKPANWQYTPVGRDVEIATSEDAEVAGTPDAKPAKFVAVFTSTKVALAGALWVCTSASLILLNKHVLASFGFHSPNLLLLFHCALAVLLVQCCRAARLIAVEPLKWELIRLWAPVSLMFVGMLATSFYALAGIGVGMFTIMKNLSNLFTISGDYIWYGRAYSWHVWLCLVLMLGSVVVGGLSDLRFSVRAYAWQLANCLFTSAYALYLSGLADRAKRYTGDKQKLSEWSMVYYNNLLAMPLIAVLVALFELPVNWQQPALHNTTFLLLAALTGVLGFFISFASMWFVSSTTATLYSLVGSMNKGVVAGVGLLAFREPTNAQNLASIVVGLLAGGLLPFAKSRTRS